MNKDRDFRSYAVLTLVMTVTFWPIILDTSVLGDGILNYELITSSKRESIIAYYNAFGLPLHGLFAYLVSFLEPLVFMHKVMAFLCILLGGYYMFGTVTKLDFLAKPVGLMCVILSVCLPVYAMWIDIAKLSYAFSYACFYAGAFYYLKYLDGVFKWRNLVLSLALLSMAFQVSSFLLYVYGFIVGIGIFELKDGRMSISKIYSFLTRHKWIILFPVVYFFGVMRIFFNPIYRYNQFDFGLKRILADTIVSAYGVVLEPFNRFLHIIDQEPFTVILFAIYSIIGVALIYFTFPNLKEKPQPYRYPSWKAFLFSLFLILLAVFPYVLVGKPIHGYGYLSKNALLLGFPIGLMITSILTELAHRSRKRLYPVFLLIIALFTMMNLTNHLTWQTRYIKYLSLIENLGKMEPPEERVIYFRDNFPFGTRMLFRHIEFDKALQLGWKHTERKYLHQLNTYVEWDYRLLYTDPLSFGRIWNIPWNMDEEMLSWKAIGPDDRESMRVSTPQYYLARTQKIFNDIGHNVPADNGFDGIGTNKVGFLSFSVNTERSEGAVCWAYLMSDQSERKRLLETIAHTEYHVIDLVE